MSPRKIFWEVDVQADFILPEGKLYIPGAEKIVPNIERLVDAARTGRVLLISSADAHAPDDPEFEEFPPHCVRGSPGARILPEGMTDHFRVIPNIPSRALSEGILDAQQIILEKQSLDVFDNPHAGELVERLGAGAEYVVFGVVTEYCVRCAAKGLLERGRKVAIVEDAIEALNPEDGRRAIAELQALGARLTTTAASLAEI